MYYVHDMYVTMYSSTCQCMYYTYMYNFVQVKELKSSSLSQIIMYTFMYHSRATVHVCMYCT